MTSTPAAARFAITLAALLLGAPSLALADELCPTQVDPGLCPDAVSDVDSYTPDSPEFIGSSVVCSQIDVVVSVIETPMFEATGHCYDEFDSAATGSSGISLPLVTETPPSQFGTTSMEVQNAVGIGTNSVALTFRSQSSATQDSSFTDIFTNYHARVWFGGGFMIQNNGSTDAQVTVTYDGFVTTTAAENGDVDITFGAQLYDTTTGSASFIGSESGFLTHNPASHSSFGLYGGGNTVCSESSCVVDASEQLGPALFVSPESTATIVAIANVRTEAEVLREGAYSAFAMDTHTLTVASTSEDVAVTLVPEPGGLVGEIAVGLVLGVLGWRRG